MTPEEKFWQLYMAPGDLADSALLTHGGFGLQIPVPGSDTAAGAAARHAERINALQRSVITRSRLGIPLLPFDEAVHGLMRGGATVFPQAIALAASFDTALVARVSGAIAQETRSRGVRLVLSPVLNIASDVRWGRVEETYGEDPLLAAAMARAFVAPFERAGVVTTAKHFVANVGEGGRDSYPADWSERRLAQYFFPPFRAAIDAGTRSVMTAYNSVDGVPATQNRRLLTDRLRRAWGFGGVVISDAAATGGPTVLQLTEPDTPTAARDAWLAGLDVVFQSTVPQYRPYWEAVRRGMVPSPTLDSAVARVLRLKVALGLFESPYVDAGAAAAANHSPEHVALAREAAREGIVLLTNDHATLPLPRTLRRIAVIGADAAEARLGGYSAPGRDVVSILGGLRAAVGDARVSFTRGPGRDSASYATVPATALARAEDGVPVAGLTGVYWDNPELAGAPRVARTDSMVDFRWTLGGPARGFPRDWYGARWTGLITAPATGIRRLGIEGNDGWRLWVDDRLAIDNWPPRSYRAILADVAIEPGHSATLRLEYHEASGPARLKLVWDTGATPDWRAAIDSAAHAAREADAAIVVVGIEEGEFRDRASLALPGRQEELIRAVAGTGTPTVVVLIGGSAITMSRWIDSVDAVLDVWYPGEQGGNAVADVLFGDADPAGRLPVTFPMSEGQLPLTYNHEPTGRGDDYVDLTGRPLFPFGFGLSYTMFAYSDLSMTPDTLAPRDSAAVRCRITNTGTRAGEEVVQLYVRPLAGSVARPVLALAGFARIRLAAGESRDVEFRLGPDQIGVVGQDGARRVVPGDVRILIGASSADIRLRGTLTVRPRA